MTEIDLAAETERAVAALAHRIRNRGDADPEVVAREYVTALLGQGWRPTPARRPEEWRRPAQPPDPETARRGAQLARQALTRGAPR